jgi:DHA1 family solute carrier family 18 vesicular amine transporter 1/2
LFIATCWRASGPALSGTLVNSIGFEWMLFGIAILNFLYAPLMYLLRNPPTKEEKKVRLSRCRHVVTVTLTGQRM